MDLIFLDYENELKVVRSLNLPYETTIKCTKKGITYQNQQIPETLLPLWEDVREKVSSLNEAINKASEETSLYLEEVKRVAEVIVYEMGMENRVEVKVKNSLYKQFLIKELEKYLSKEIVASINIQEGME